MHDKDSNGNHGISASDQKVKRYDNTYYYIRELYFTPLSSNDGQVEHKYTSFDMEKMAREKFHVSVSASTIRNWIHRKDKDLEGRSWREEWNRMMAVGILTASGQPSDIGHPFNTEETNRDEDLSPMQKLAVLKQRSLINDMDIALAGDAFIKLFIKDIRDEYERTQRVPVDMLKTLASFQQPAKNRMLNELKDLQEMEKEVDKELMYGRLVPLKDPASRERVRRVFIEMLQTAYERGESTSEN